MLLGRFSLMGDFWGSGLRPLTLLFASKRLQALVPASAVLLHLLQRRMQLDDLRHAVVARHGRGAVPQQIGDRPLRHARLSQAHAHRVAQVVDVQETQPSLPLRV